MIHQSVVQKLVKQKLKLTIVQEEGKTNVSKVKSPVRRKSKSMNHSCKENDKKRKKFICDNANDKKRTLKMNKKNI